METSAAFGIFVLSLLLFWIVFMILLYLATQNKLPSWPQIKKWGRKSRPYKWFHQ